MRHPNLVFLLALGMFSCGAVAQTTGALNILSPQNGYIYTGTVNVRYAAVNGVAAAGTPRFMLKVDGEEVARTTNTEYTLAGLTPGLHILAVLLVDANATPIYPAQDQVQFWVKSTDAEGNVSHHNRN